MQKKKKKGKPTGEEQPHAFACFWGDAGSPSFTDAISLVEQDNQLTFVLAVAMGSNNFLKVP